MNSSKTRAFFILAGILSLSIFLSSGCKNLLGANDPSAVPNQPAAPPEPVVVDGARTSYADIVEKVAPAVVKITSEHKEKAEQLGSPGEQPGIPFPFGGQQPQRRGPSIQRGLGSGVIVSADGTILTNNHVIEGAEKVQVELTDKRSFEAKVVGADKLSDLALLKVDAKDLPYLNFGDSDRVRVGDVVLAIGNPLGIGQTVTAGIISAKGRRTGLSDGSFEDFLQTDAPINEGNSGGPLINVSGEMIGINSQILSRSGGNIGIGFSIPSNMAKSVIDQLEKDGKVHRGQMGVVVQNVTADLAESFKLKGLEGVVVAQVKKDSAADKAGIKTGDVILSLNGEKIEDSNILRNKVAATAPGTEITLKIQRDGGEQDVKLTLNEASQDSPAEGLGTGTGPSKESGPADSGKLGITVEPLTSDLAKKLGLPADTKGLVVADVDADGPAAEAGIREADVILSVNRQEVQTVDEMKDALSKSPSKALLLVSRRGQALFLPVPLNP
jgi:Do/DeqQ family serine protease